MVNFDHERVKESRRMHDAFTPPTSIRLAVRRGHAVLLVGVAIAALPCCKSRAPSTAEVERAWRRAGMARTARFVNEQRPRYGSVLDRAIKYIGGFSIDPLALRKQGLKGRKKLVEQLDAYVAIHRHTKGARRSSVAERFRQAARVTASPEYHDMGSVDDKQFRQDATSYLRACYLMDRMGLQTAAYQRAIRAIKPRLDAHLPTRGPHQQMVFSFYYKHFKLPLPAALRRPAKGSVFSRRLNPYTMSMHQAYQLTHEVFVPCDYGGRLQPAGAFSAADRRYLRRALEILTTIHQGKRNVDLVGELLACLRFLGYTDLQVYREGLRYVLSSQRGNGSFGDYERLRQQRGERLELDLYLHTTSVVMDILPLAFEGPAATVELP
jgi:hypothetical protein